MKALVKGARTYSVFGRVLKCTFRLFRRQGLEFGANRFEFRNKTSKFDDAPFSVAIGMLHEYGEVVRRKVSGNRIPETTEIAVMAKLPPDDLFAAIAVTEYAKVEAHV